MPLPIHIRYEIVFLSNHPKGPQLSHVDVAKTVHCSMSTVKYWLNRWMQSKDLTDPIPSGRLCATTQKQDQGILSLAEEQPFTTAQDIKKQLERQGVVVSERTVCRRFNEAGARYSWSMTKPLLTEHHQQKHLRWAQQHKATDWNQVISSNETTVRLNCVKGLVWNFPGKKESFVLLRIQSR